MQLTFSKMQALGNDFVVIDNLQGQYELSAPQLRLLADRHFGVGCDQILFIDAAQNPGIDFIYRIFNADGMEVEQCGNGARCFAKYVQAHGLTVKNPIRVETNTGVIVLKITGQDVEVDMGQPNFSPAALPFAAPQQQAQYTLNIDGYQAQFGAVSMGNPHITLIVPDVEQAEVAKLGALLQARQEFAKSVNVGFMQIISADEIKLRVYERGVGETLACGSGACAAMVIGVMQGHLNSEVKVRLPGGALRVQWHKESRPSVLMTGGAEFVFHGQIEI